MSDGACWYRWGEGCNAMTNTGYGDAHSCIRDKGHDSAHSCTCTAQIGPAAPLSTLPERPDEDDTKPVTPHERTLILQRVANHERGHDTGLTTRAVLYLRGYEARLSSLERELDGVRKDAERLDFLDDRTHLYETPVLDCYGGDRYEVTIGDADHPLIGNGASLREALDAAMSALRERSK